MIKKEQLKITAKEIKESQLIGKKTKYGEILLSKDNRLVIHNRSSEKVLKFLHNLLEHPGKSQLYNSIRKYIFIPNIKKTISKVIKDCIACQKNRNFKASQGKLEGYISSEKPVCHISSDIFGLIPTSEFIADDPDKKFYFLTFTDICTRWSEVIPITDITAIR